MPWGVLADVVVLFHLGFVLFVVFGGLLLFRWPRLVWLHVPAAVWGALIEFGGWICPLTPLENRFRALAGERQYGEGFIERYLIPLIYPGELTRAMQIGMGVFVIVLNVIIYTLVARKRRRS